MARASNLSIPIDRTRYINPKYKDTQLHEKNEYGDAQLSGGHD